MCSCWRRSPRADRRLARGAWAALGLAALAAAVPARAQTILGRANALLREGRVFAAESLYYLAVAREPHDPRTRLALGRYLVSRGRWWPGVVLMEEARFFGAEADLVAVDLAPAYARLGDFRALASLPGTPLRYAEQLRADWLADHPPVTAGPDSSDVPFAPEDSALGGRIALIIGTDTLSAMIDANGGGLLLDTSWARRPEVRAFHAAADAEPRGWAATVRALVIGDDTLRNAPAHFVPMPADAGQGWRYARVGLDFLGTLAPTFDPGKRRLTIRAGGRIALSRPGTRIPTLDTGGDLAMIRDRLLPLSSPDGFAVLGGRRWTLNPRRGEVILDAP